MGNFSLTSRPDQESESSLVAKSVSVAKATDRRFLPEGVYNALAPATSDERWLRTNARLDEIDERMRMASKAVATQMFGIPPGGRSGVNRYEVSITSRNGEDGILLYIFSQIGTSLKRFVEIGIGDGSECNTRNLSMSWGWAGLLIEADESMACTAKTIYERAD
jgi:hypothetical protein